MPKTQQGFLLIADISGYTMYLSQSELEHAQEVLSALLRLLIDHTRPPLAISRTAGDAVISYGLEDNFLQGQTFVELIEDTYVAFRRMIDLMVMNNTCQCRACANISTLDLKFFVHHGAFGIQRLGDHDELIGSDVNLIHRLLKNRVVEATGIRAYTLYSDVAIRRLGLEGFCEKLVAHRESYEHLGEIGLWVQDMHPVWQAKRDALQISIPAEAIFLQVSADIAAPPHVVWNCLIQPEFRQVLIASDRQEIVGRKDGRIAEGSAFQCYHGDRLTVQTVIQWRPFEQMITEDLFAIPGSHMTAVMGYDLQPTDRGTRLVQTMSKGKASLYGRAMMGIMMRTTMKSMLKQAQQDMDNFRDVVEQQILLPAHADHESVA